MNHIVKKISKPKILIIGPGVVGLATGKGFISKGFEVGFIGRTEEKVRSLKDEGLTAYSIEEARTKASDYDISFLTVPTLTVSESVDFRPMWEASVELGKRISKMDKYHLVVVKSTVPPGTTRNLVVRIVEKYSGKKVGFDFGACMNPEYLREESAYEDFVKPWLTVIGEYDKKSGDILEAVYSAFDAPIRRVALRDAEMQKYVHNIFNATKISFFNEMREICKRIGVDAKEVFELVTKSAEGMWNPAYGTRDFGPFGGACLPKDTQGFLTWAKERGFNPMLLAAVIEVNESLKEEDAMKEKDERMQAPAQQLSK